MPKQKPKTKPSKSSTLKLPKANLSTNPSTVKNRKWYQAAQGLNAVAVKVKRANSSNILYYISKLKQSANFKAASKEE